MHPFYDLPRPLLWSAALAMAAAGLAPIVLFFLLVPTVVDHLGAVGAVLLPVAYFALIPVAQVWMQLATAPLLRLTGRLRYLSPMLLVENPGPRAYHVHGGTGFDYLLHLRWRDRGAAAARKTALFYLQGLRALAEQARRGEIPPELRIVASSHVFSAATARRLGFAVVPTTAGDRVGLWVNALNLVLKHSFARGRLALPRLGRVKRAETTAGELARRAGELDRLLARLGGAGGAGRDPALL